MYETLTHLAAFGDLSDPFYVMLWLLDILRPNFLTRRQMTALLWYLVLWLGLNFSEMHVS